MNRSAFLLIVAVIFNFYRQWVGVIAFQKVVVVQSLCKSEFAMYMPWLNALWILALARKLWVMRLGRETRDTRLAGFGLDAFCFLVIYLMITGPPVFEYDQRVKQALVLIFAFRVFVVGKELYRFLVRRPPTPWKLEGIGKAGL